ncbi:transmembrane protein 14C [Petromyzon marinus]
MSQRGSGSRCDTLDPVPSARCQATRQALSARSLARMPVDWIGYGYAALVASGGVIGYVKAGSVPSLAAGLLFGGLAGFGAYQTSNDPKNVWAALAASGLLTGVMGMRFYNSGKLFPAGIIAGASLMMVGRLGMKMLAKPHEP